MSSESLCLRTSVKTLPVGLARGTWGQRAWGPFQRWDTKSVHAPFLPSLPCTQCLFVSSEEAELPGSSSLPTSLDVSASGEGEPRVQESNHYLYLQAWVCHQFSYMSFFLSLSLFSHPWIPHALRPSKNSWTLIFKAN